MSASSLHGWLHSLTWPHVIVTNPPFPTCILQIVCVIALIVTILLGIFCTKTLLIPMGVSKIRETKLACECLDQWSDSGDEEILWIRWKSVCFQSNHDVGRSADSQKKTPCGCEKPALLKVTSKDSRTSISKRRLSGGESGRDIRAKSTTEY